MLSKVCIGTCKLEKPLSEFYKRGDSDKHCNTCKACVIAADKKRKEYKKAGVGKLVPEDQSGELICNKCHDRKNVKHFVKRTGRPGYFKTCKYCKKEIEQLRRYE